MSLVGTPSPASGKRKVEAAMQGYLRKLSPAPLKGWQRRYFVLKGRCLFYFKTREDYYSNARVRGCIDLDNVTRVFDSKEQPALGTDIATIGGRTYHLLGASIEEKSTWMAALSRIPNTTHTVEQRVTIFRNGTNSNGKVVILPASLRELLDVAGEKLGMEVASLFNAHGGEVDAVSLLAAGDVLFATAPNESFRPPSSSVWKSDETDPSSKQMFSTLSMEDVLATIRERFLLVPRNDSYFEEDVEVTNDLNVPAAIPAPIKGITSASFPPASRSLRSATFSMARDTTPCPPAEVVPEFRVGVPTAKVRRESSVVENTRNSVTFLVPPLALPRKHEQRDEEETLTTDWMEERDIEANDMWMQLLREELGAKFPQSIRYGGRLFVRLVDGALHLRFDKEDTL